MGSNLSCVTKEKGPPPAADNVYAEAGDCDGVTDSAGASHNSDSHDHCPSPPVTPRPPHRPVEKSSSSNICITDNNNHHQHHHQHHHNGAEKPLRVSQPALLPPQSKPATNARSKPIIPHDENGYALPFAKPGNHAIITNGNSHDSSSEAKVKVVRKTPADNNKANSSSAAPKVGVKTFVLPVTTLKPTEKDSHHNNGRDMGTMSPTKHHQQQQQQPGTGAYCNVVLADEKETRSFSNEIYEDTEIPEVPENTRSPAVKVHNNQAKSKDSSLNYIQVEFVNPPEVTSKPPPPRVRRSPSPTQYTDVIMSENGSIRLVN